MWSPSLYTPDALPTICGQWNAFVELLPLWLAPNMVTLLGFFFILTNVICLEIWMPDLVGPVGDDFYVEPPSAVYAPRLLNKP